MVKRKNSYKKGNICRATTKSNESKIRNICNRFGKNSRKCKEARRRSC